MAKVTLSQLKLETSVAFRKGMGRIQSQFNLLKQKELSQVGMMLFHTVLSIYYTETHKENAILIAISNLHL